MAVRSCSDEEGKHASNDTVSVRLNISNERFLIFVVEINLMTRQDKKNLNGTEKEKHKALINTNKQMDVCHRTRFSVGRGYKMLMVPPKRTNVTFTPHY